MAITMGTMIHEEMYVMYHDHPTPAQERALLAQVEQAQQANAARYAARHTPTPIAQRLPSVIDRVNDYAAYLTKRIADSRTSTHLILKIARAMAEGRIAEGSIHLLVDRLDNASNRGAYFVAGAKKVFAAANLSWFEEEWQ